MSFFRKTTESAVLLVLLAATTVAQAPRLCVTAECEDDRLLEWDRRPQGIENCSNCQICLDYKFPSCVYLLIKETGSHCACFNSLPSMCTYRTSHLVDAMTSTIGPDEKPNYNVACSSNHEDVLEQLPAATILNVTVTGNETQRFAIRIGIPISSIKNTKRYADLTFKTVFLHIAQTTDPDDIFMGEIDPSKINTTAIVAKPMVVVNASETESIDGDQTESTPAVDDGDVDQSNRAETGSWTAIDEGNFWTFDLDLTEDQLPAVLRYSIDYDYDKFEDSSDGLVKVASYMGNWKSLPLSLTAGNLTNTSLLLSGDLASAGDGASEVSDPNYTLVALIVVGTILGMGLSCAFASCKDKLNHRNTRKTRLGSVFDEKHPEVIDSARVATSSRNYGVVENGNNGIGNNNKKLSAEHAVLLSSSERQPMNETLPMSEHRSKPREVAYDDDIDRSMGPITQQSYATLAKQATKIKSGNLDLLESVGNGEFGVIRRGYVFDRTESMIHCLRPLKQLSPDLAEPLLERLDASVRGGYHPNLISLLGVCQEEDVLYVCLQMETGPNLRNMLRESRCLDQFLQYTDARGRLSLISPQRLLNIILGITRGMSHLEERQVLHDNLSAINIVICDNGTPKIAGFGMATLSDLYMRQLEKNHDQLRWLPPETHHDGMFSLKSQTWSYGVVLWEIVTFGGTPYFSLSDDEVITRVAAGYRLPTATNCSRQMDDLMRLCWRDNPEERPDFTHIHQYVQELNLDPEIHISVTYHDGFSYEPIHEMIA